MNTGKNRCVARGGCQSVRGESQVITLHSQYLHKMHVQTWVDPIQGHQLMCFVPRRAQVVINLTSTLFQDHCVRRYRRPPRCHFILNVHSGLIITPNT